MTLTEAFSRIEEIFSFSILLFDFKFFYYICYVIVFNRCKLEQSFTFSVFC